MALQERDVDAADLLVVRESRDALQQLLHEAGVTTPLSQHKVDTQRPAPADRKLNKPSLKAAVPGRANAPRFKPPAVQYSNEQRGVLMCWVLHNLHVSSLTCYS